MANKLEKVPVNGSLETEEGILSSRVGRLGVLISWQRLDRKRIEILERGYQSNPSALIDTERGMFPGEPVYLERHFQRFRGTHREIDKTLDMYESGNYNKSPLSRTDIEGNVIIEDLE